MQEKTPGFKRLAGAVLALALVVPGPALAHAFGVRYDLPLPLWLYLSGAAAAVALTFVVIAVFLKAGEAHKVWRKDVTDLAPFCWLLHPAVYGAVRIISVGLFVVIVATGLFGVASPVRNFAPTMVWVIWWVGLAFASALLGNLWDALNPWTILFDWANALCRRLGLADNIELNLPYPERLSLWPAVILFFAFAWLELISGFGEIPRNLAWLILAYSAITWTGMILYGRQTWLEHGEAFTRAFDLLSRFAPFNAGMNGQLGRRFEIRPYSIGLLVDKPVPFSMTVFVVLMLSTVTFDGFLETSLWAAFLDWLSESRAMRPALLAAQGQGLDLLIIVKTIALGMTMGLFLAVYTAFCLVMRWAGGVPVEPSVLINTFVMSLVPIAIAYHIAHYLSYLLLAGQLIIPLASDPFGFGWNLFGTAQYSMDITVINAKTVWYTAVSTIVIGHILAVYLAHVMAQQVYRDPKAAMKSQGPMLVLMVLYTMISLWILSQPIVQ